MKSPALRLLLLLLSFCLPALILAQEKGVTPIPSRELGILATPHSTRAVVIGISDYQDPAIPDLRFADRDAEAFANFLRSPAGGGLDNDHLKVLTNENATAGRIAEALDGLIEQVKEGDQVIIYFSGHGDVERKIFSQPGFLLCWDAPARVYMGGGTYSLSFLEAVVTTLSVQNRAKVTVITDACHAGKLAGSQIGGAQLTSVNLARQYANEVKILSCQPNEFSLEGEQWGGGRGVFSYHLVDGLFGLADRNSDGTITVGEIDRYLEDKVTAEAAPQSQVPMLLGNKTEQLASVDAAILAALKKNKASGLPVFAATESRGLEEEVLSKLDSGIVQQYLAFKKAVAEKRFFPVVNVGEVLNLADVTTASADALYARLIGVEALAPLRGIMTRNYAAALQDDAQQTLNEWLNTSQEVSLDAIINGRLTKKVFTEKVRTYPRCLDRATELLGEKHYMYAALKARKYFFEGFLLANSNRNPNSELGERALALFRQSLEWQPEQPQVYWQMSLVFGYNFLQPDSLEYHARLAMEIYPNWVLPCIDAAFYLSHKLKRQDRAKIFLEQASHKGSNSALVLHAWAVFNYGEKNYLEAERQIKEAILLDSTLGVFWNTLGVLYDNTGRYAEAEPVIKKVVAMDSTHTDVWNNLGTLYINTRRYAEAELALKKSIALDSTNSAAWNNLGKLYRSLGRYAEAEPVLKKSVALDSTNAFAWNNLGTLYLYTNRFAEAEPVLKKSIALDSTNANFWSNLGAAYFRTGRYTEAEPAFKKSITLDSTDIITWNSLGAVYNISRRYAEAELAFKKFISLDSTSATVWVNLGYVYLQTHRFAEAESTFKKSIALDSTNIYAWQYLIDLYNQTRRYAEAEAGVQKALAIDSTLAWAHAQLGRAYFKTNRPEEARQEFLKTIELSPQARMARLGMAWLLTAEGKTNEALDWVAQAIEKGGAPFEVLQSDEDLAPLRALPEWKALMKKYFPDKVKD